MRRRTWEKEVKKIQAGLSQNVVLRMPREDDGARIWELARDISVLDLNSAYSYLMLCKYFPDTCVVAEHKDQIIGFVTAFRLPKQPVTIFAHGSERAPAVAGALEISTFELRSFTWTGQHPV